MRIKTITYHEYAGQPREWLLDELSLGSVNLLVGKNASGKTRTLNLLRNIGLALAGKRPVSMTGGTFDLLFDHEGKEHKYHVASDGGKVANESLRIAGECCFERAQGGEGTIRAEQLKKDIKFQTPEDQLAVVARQDSIQHPFLRPLAEWGKSMLHFAFASGLRPEVLAVFVKDGPKADLTQTENVVPVFREGHRRFGDAFVTGIKKDMAEIGYCFEDIGLKPPETVSVVGQLPGELLCLYVKECDLPCHVEQTQMSQGMFRALSVIIQMNFAQRGEGPTCVIVDDIGEGLDFDRSTSLIKLLVAKAEQSGVQLVMSTNDRFVMNAVPLEAWSLLHRQGPRCHVYNYENQKAAFEQFKFTGLNNFDFLASDFLKLQDKGAGHAEACRLR